MRNSVTQELHKEAKDYALTGVRAYLLAAVCAGLALLLRLLLDPIWMDRLPYATFFLAVIAVAQFAEAGASVWTVVAGFLLGAWFFVEPRHSLLISNPIDRVNSVFYFVICLGILFFT